MSMISKESLRFYEEILVLHPDTTETERQKVFSQSKEVIKSFQGSVFYLNSWGSRSLANPGEKKLTRGQYFHMVFSSQGQGIQELRRLLRINDKVVYFHHEKLSEKTQVDKYMEKFHESLANTQRREQERQLKLQKYKANANGSYPSKRR